MYALLVTPKRGGLSAEYLKKGVREETKGHLLSRTHLKCYPSINLVYIGYSQNFYIGYTVNHPQCNDKKLNSVFSSSVSRTVNA